MVLISKILTCYLAQIVAGETIVADIQPCYIVEMFSKSFSNVLELEWPLTVNANDGDYQFL